MATRQHGDRFEYSPEHRFSRKPFVEAELPHRPTSPVNGDIRVIFSQSPMRRDCAIHAARERRIRLAW
jgi:hypothetical protein